MLAASIPAKFGIPWAASASGAYIRAIPQASQIGITAGAASLTDGFPPANFLPIGAGGTPPFGQDFNGILKQITQWNQWQAAGGPVGWDSTFSTNIGGYPKGAVLGAGGTGIIVGQYWLNAIDGNASNPDTGGANWTAFLLLSPLNPNPAGTTTRTKLTLDAYGRSTSASSGVQPTYQKFTSGSGTATPSAGVVRWRVRLAGGGGGGGGGSGGGTGGATSLGTGGAQWAGIGGTGGGAAFTTAGTGGFGAAGGTGGTGGANGSPGTLVERSAGGPGVPGFSVASGTAAIAINSAAPGGTNRLGGGPNSGQGGQATGGVTAFANQTAGAAGSGGAGEFVEFDIINPSAMAYVVGAGGSAGGVAGQTGIILIQENYD